jgi:6-phosphogluconolactonase (cycloisomerase 2 family)
MEMKSRMSKRFAWVLGAVVLMAIGLLVACGSKYSSSSDGLMLVGSQGSALVETFSFNLSNGHIAEVSNPPSSTSGQTCVLPGIPSSLVVDPAGAYAYAILTANSSCTGSKNGIVSFKINSNGTIGAPGTVVADPNPVALVMDSSGKFLFVAEGTNSAMVETYAISNGSLTLVPGTFTFTNGSGFMKPNIVAIAATPTVFPKIGSNGLQNAVCSDVGNNPPTTEYLYAADYQNNVVWEYSVNTSTGALGNPGTTASNPSFSTGTQPSGVAVDPCNRFVFVGNYLSNNVNAYTICNGSTTSAQTCPAPPDGSLVAVSGSPFSLSGNANGPGPIAVDPFGNFLYVVEGSVTSTSGTITPFQISPVSGGLTSKGVVATGAGPVSIAIRGDDNWLFVADYGAATVSQYSITPATGALSPLSTIQTDNYPWGVAVK